MHDRLPLRGMCLESCGLVKFWEISDNSLLMVQDRDIVGWLQWYTNRKLYAAYRMALLPVPLNDLVGHFGCLTRF